MEKDAKDNEGTLLSSSCAMSFVCFPELNSDLGSSESEDEDDYRKGGYHPVQIGDSFKHGRYVILQKLGWGHFSTVWLGFDTIEARHCAIKVQKSDPHYAEAARDEIRLLRSLEKKGTSSAQPIVELLDYFIHHGPHGHHYCLTFEVLSKSLLSLVKRYNYNGIPVSMAKSIGKQILEALVYIHETCGVIHTDLKPENVLFLPCETEQQKLHQEASRAAAEIQKCRERIKVHQPRRPHIGEVYRPDSDLAFASGRVKLVDFGNACWINEHFTDDIQTRQYRAPEVILGCGYDTKADMWSLACLLFELLTGDFLFDPHGGSNYDRDEDHLALMIELLGPIPANVLEKGEHTTIYFDENGELRQISRLNFWGLRNVLLEKYKFATNEADAVTNFLLPMLRYNSEERVSAKDHLGHAFLAESIQVAKLSPDSENNAPLVSGAHKPARSAPGESFLLPGAGTQGLSSWPVRLTGSIN